MILVLLTVSVSLLAYVLYKWLRRNDEFFAARKIPYLKRSFYLGSNGLILGKFNMIELSEILYKALPNERLIGFFDFTQPKHVARDPELIRQMAIKDFDHFEDHPPFIDEKVDKLFGNSLIMLTGRKWREMRATLSPAFTGSKMRQMFELVTECVGGLTEFLDQRIVAGHPIDDEVKSILAKTSNDVIASCAFGIKVNSFIDENNEFYVAGKSAFNFSIIASIRIFIVIAFPKVARLFNIRFISSDFYKRIVVETIEERQKRNIFRPDMINILMQIRQGGSVQTTSAEDSQVESNESLATAQESQIGKMKVQRQWTDDELAAQAFLFYTAGFDNISGTTAFAVYAVAVHHDVQAKLYAEIREMEESLGGKRLDYESMQKMRYLDQVICETLRMWPSLTATDRLCVKDYVYDDGNLSFEMKKGDSFTIPIYSFHHDEKFYHDADRFDPDRFSPENKTRIVPGTYMPFGVGPRNCIGNRFALMVIKAIIYYLVLNFLLEPNGKTQIPLKFKRGNPFGVESEKGIFVDVKRRV